MRYRKAHSLDESLRGLTFELSLEYTLLNPVAFTLFNISMYNSTLCYLINVMSRPEETTESYLS